MYGSFQMGTISIQMGGGSTPPEGSKRKRHPSPDGPGEQRGPGGYSPALAAQPSPALAAQPRSSRRTKSADFRFTFGEEHNLRSRLPPSSPVLLI